MALPEKDITVTLVKNTLGAGTNDVGSLCIHKNVNKWSKYKPNYEADREFFSFFLNEHGFWDYVRPTGGAAHPYRLGDFRGYDHKAQSPVIVGAPDVVDVTSKNMYLRVTYRLPLPVYNGLPDLYGNDKEYILVTDAIHVNVNQYPNYIYDYAKLSSAARGGADLNLYLQSLPIYKDEQETWDFHFGVWRMISSEAAPDLNDIRNYEFMYEIGNGTEADGSVKNILFRGTQDRPIPTVKMDIYVDPAYREDVYFTNPYYDIVSNYNIVINISNLSLNYDFRLGFLTNGNPNSFEEITRISMGYYPTWRFETSTNHVGIDTFELRKV